MGWKAPNREERVPVSRFQLFGGRAESCDEFRVQPVELLAHPLAEGVEAGNWGLLRPVVLGPRILSPN